MTFARSFASGLGLLALIGAPLAAQSKRPPTWKIVLDHPAADSVRELSTMPPGWHITTGPGARFFDPAWQIGAADTLHVEVFLFPDSGPEEYGVFLSSEPPEADFHGVVVALRRDGQLAVFRESGAHRETLTPWQAHASINALPANPESPVKNVIRLEPAGSQMNVVVNGVVVAKAPGGTGQAGLRVGAGMNLHVSKFEVRR
jgi:hypothetical protein